MFKKIILSIVSLFLLSGCADSFRSYFKRSANNKLIDTKGFDGGKRKPLYNKKYISLAKKNMVEENYDDEDDIDNDDDQYELEDPSRLNRMMYLDMLKADAKRKKRARLQNYKASYRKNYDQNDDRYPSLAKANSKVDQAVTNEDELQKELSEIKSMLQDTKADLAKYKCPMQQGAKTSPANKPPAKKPDSSKLKKKFIKEENGDDEVIHPMAPSSL